MTCEEEWYLRCLRNGPFDPEMLRAQKRMAAWYDAEEVHENVFKNLGNILGMDCEEMKSLNDEYATFLGRHGKPQEAGRIRKSAEEIKILKLELEASFEGSFSP